MAGKSIILMCMCRHDRLLLVGSETTSLRFSQRLSKASSSPPPGCSLRPRSQLQCSARKIWMAKCSSRPSFLSLRRGMVFSRMSRLSSTPHSSCSQDFHPSKSRVLSRQSGRAGSGKIHPRHPHPHPHPHPPPSSLFPPPPPQTFPPVFFFRGATVASLNLLSCCILRLHKSATGRL